MKALLRFLAATGLIVGFLVATTPAATADAAINDVYNCSTNRISQTTHQDMKYCVYKFFMPSNDAKMTGNSAWYYTYDKVDKKWGGHGDVYGDVFDTKADGQCAGSVMAEWINGSLEQVSPLTKACGTGNDKRYEYRINDGSLMSGDPNPTPPDNPSSRPGRPFAGRATTKILFESYLCQPASACDPSGKTFSEQWTMMDKCTFASNACRIEWIQWAEEPSPLGT